jgi:putative hydrolase of the HAD superfamily
MDLDEASRTIVEHALRDLGRRERDLACAIAADYRERRLAGIAPYPGAIETLTAFRTDGVRMALITNGNGEAQRGSIERFGLAQYFECIVIEGEFGCGKPDERVFRHALASCGVDPIRAWMVGDDLDADIAPALALGMHAVWVDAEGAGLPGESAVRPHRTVRAIAELLG